MHAVPVVPFKFHSLAERDIGIRERKIEGTES